MLSNLGNPELRAKKNIRASPHHHGQERGLVGLHQQGGIQEEGCGAPRVSHPRGYHLRIFSEPVDECLGVFESPKGGKTPKFFGFERGKRYALPHSCCLPLSPCPCHLLLPPYRPLPPPATPLPPLTTSYCSLLRLGTPCHPLPPLATPYCSLLRLGTPCHPFPPLATPCHPLAIPLLPLLLTHLPLTTYRPHPAFPSPSPSPFSHSPLAKHRICMVSSPLLYFPQPRVEFVLDCNHPGTHTLRGREEQAFMDRLYKEAKRYYFSVFFILFTEISDFLTEDQPFMDRLKRSKEVLTFPFVPFFIFRNFHFFSFVFFCFSNFPIPKFPIPTHFSALY
jgi:hypothetical protein